MFSEYVTVRSNPALSGKVPGRFHEWDIAFKNRDGNTEVWTISDHTLKINNDKYWIFSPNRYSAEQALGLELMEISFAMVGEQVHKEILQPLLSEAEADCVVVDISFRNGWPDPEVYDSLLRESWFKAMK